MHQMNSEMQQCIENCQKCHASCLQHAMNHCLEVGGRHTEPEHFKLMMACAEICQTAANFMLIGTPHHKHVCAECAEICEECAKSCEAVGDMDECVEACRKCAASCDMMAAM
jgi:hypothetical protein